MAKVYLIGTRSKLLPRTFPLTNCTVITASFATHFDAVPESPSTLTLDDSVGVPSSESTSCSLMPSPTLPKFSSLTFEHAATANVYTREEWDRKKAAEAEQRRAQKAAPVAAAEAAELSQEETMGDFYFEQHNYPAALEQYNIALL